MILYIIIIQVNRKNVFMKIGHQKHKGKFDRFDTVFIVLNTLKFGVNDRE